MTCRGVYTRHKNKSTHYAHIFRNDEELLYNVSDSDPARTKGYVRAGYPHQFTGYQHLSNYPQILKESIMLVINRTM